MANQEDPDQSNEDLNAILKKIKEWNISSTNVHKGTSKRVYVKRPTNAEPTEPWAYLTSRKQTMAKPDIVVKEYKYTLYLHTLFGDYIIPELPINAKNKPLTNILNAGRGLHISKKPIVKDVRRSDIENLLQFMMNSTDYFIDQGFANLDLKPQNIGKIGDRFYINDNGSNMFYPIPETIPETYKEKYRDAIKLTGICTLIDYGLNAEMFNKYKHLYPTLDFKRAIELIRPFEPTVEKEIIDYAKQKMTSVNVDGETVDLSSLFEDILFPDQILFYYGSVRSYDIPKYIETLENIGLISDEERLEREKAEQARIQQAERMRLKRKGNSVNTRNRLGLSPNKKYTRKSPNILNVVNSIGLSPRKKR
jgi:hypothetical protein